MDWFHKKTFSGRFLSFHSSHPLCHKIGMIYGLIDRAFLLSHPRMKNSSNRNFKNNKNGSDVINKKSWLFLILIKISELVATAIDKSQYTIGYRVLNHLGEFIRAYKDTNNLLMNNNVVYKISCKDCDASYARLARLKGN